MLNLIMREWIKDHSSMLVEGERFYSKETLTWFYWFPIRKVMDIYEKRKDRSTILAARHNPATFNFIKQYYKL